MKTSNKIFISFLIFLFGGITLLFIGSKYNKGLDDESNFAKLEKPLTSFSVVVAEPGANFVLKSGKQNKIVQNYLKDVVPDFAPYEIRNDTLFVYSVKKEDSNKQGQTSGGYFIIVPDIFCQKVKNIIAKERANVKLMNYEVDSLFVKLTKSDFFWNFKKTNFVNIVAKDSYMRLEVGSIKNINVQLDKTQLWIESKKKTNEISGSLINDSYIDNAYKNGAVESKISLKLDKSSNLRLSRN